MTLKIKSNVCGMHKKSRMVLRCALMTLKSKSKVCRARKKENGAGMGKDDSKE